VLGLAYGLVAEAIGLHIILGAYMAGLFFEEKVASAELVQKVTDRLEGIAYSFLGPIFFISLGFHITFDVLKGESLAFVLVLTIVLLVGQIVSAGGHGKVAKVQLDRVVFRGRGHVRTCRNGIRDCRARVSTRGIRCTSVVGDDIRHVPGQHLHIGWA